MNNIDVSNLTKEKINIKSIKTVFDVFCQSYKFKKDVSLVLIGDCRMKSINSMYRGLNKSTDVLSFVDLNEIFISIPQIKKQAKKDKKSFKDEFFFVLVHGLLHLKGYNDDTEKKRLSMIERGNKLLELIKI